MHMGIAGSAIASSVSCAAAAGMVVWYMLFRSQTVKMIMLKLSMTSLYLTLRNTGYMARSGFSSMLGELAMSMMLITGNYVFIVNNSVAQSAQPIISYNYGAGNKNRVKKAFMVSIRTAAICGVMATTLLTLAAKPLVGLFLQPGSKPYEIAVSGLPLFAYSAIFFALNVAVIGYYQATEQNSRATLFMLLRGLLFLIPAFILMPLLVAPQGMWLAVPVTECMTLGVILLTNKRV